MVLANPAYVDLITGDTYRHETHYMGLVDENNHPDYYDGEIRSSTPRATRSPSSSPTSYLDHIAERVEPWTYLKFPVPEGAGWKGLIDGQDSGVYRAAPLARLNVADGMSTPLAQEQYERMMATLGGQPVHVTLAYHWARVIELLNAAEMAHDLARDPEITDPDIRTIPTETPDRRGRRGGGAAGHALPSLHDRRERHRHPGQPHRRHDQQLRRHQPVDQEGQPGPHREGREVTDGVLNMIEMAFRAYDPCFGCATHSLPGQMPLEVAVYRETGELIAHRLRE